MKNPTSRMLRSHRRLSCWPTAICAAALSILAIEARIGAAGGPAPAANGEAAAVPQPRSLGQAPLPPGTRSSDPISAPAIDSIIPIEGEVCTLDLQSAWRLAGVQNPTINAARMAIVESEAVQRQAALVWFPNLNAGSMFHRHVGSLLASFGQMRQLNETSLYFGGGARTVAAESNGIPMIQFFVPIADGVFNPLAARQQTAVTRYDATATNNNILLDTTVAYLDLLAAETQVEAYRLSRGTLQQVVDTTAAYAKTGQGRDGDANRAAADALLVIVSSQRAEETLAISSAELARLLHLDPSTRLKTPGGPLRTFDLVDLERPMNELIEVALRFRPELAARGMAVAEGRTRLRQEQVRPLLPLVTFGYSAGGFGGTGNFVNTVAPFTGTYGRTDLDAMAVWTLQNMGAGNLAHANQRRSQLDQRIFDRVRMVNQVRREVTESYGFCLGERRQVRISLRRLAEAEAGFHEDYQRFIGFQSLPIEVLNSARLLVDARRSLVEAFIGDNEAQFRLFVAMGQPPYHAASQLSAQLAPQGNTAQDNAPQGNTPPENVPPGNPQPGNAPQGNLPR